MLLSSRLIVLRWVLRMSKLTALIEELCPEGVGYKPLGEVVQIRNGKDWKSQAPGDIPVYGSGGRMQQSVAVASSKGPSVLLPRKGSLEVQYVEEPIWNVDTVFTTVCDAEVLNTRFFYFAMKVIDLGRISTSATRPSLTQSALRKLSIPVPPLEVQQEIVRVLDALIDLEQNLVSELKLRKKQFSQIRSSLINAEGRDTVPLGTIAQNLDSRRIPITQRDRVAGDIPYYGASGIVDYVADYIFDGDYLLISEDGANLKTRVAPIAFSISGKSWVNNHAHVLEFDTYSERKFVEHYINQSDISAFVSGGAQPKLNQKNLSALPIPVYSLSEKDCAVFKLDGFESLSQSIEQEIALRRKQYEFYRDELLTFKTKEA